MALQYLKESADKAPGNAFYQYQLGLAYLKTGKTQEARQALERSLKLNPKFEDARRTLASL